MEHMAWKGRIKPGCKEEYKRRHDAIWPEMVEVLKKAGICNYSIFYVNDELFGYYECEKGVAYAEKVQAESPVVDRWNDYMKDILELEMDPETGAQPKLEQVFRLDCFYLLRIQQNGCPATEQPFCCIVGAENLCNPGISSYGAGVRRDCAPSGA